MSQTCLSNGKLAGVIFGAILGTLLICAVFIVLLWQWFKRHKNDSKIFYVERAADKTQTNDAEIGNGSVGHDSTGLETKREESVEKKDSEQTDSNQIHKLITQQSIVLNDKRYSTNLLSHAPISQSPKVLPNLGVTIAKMPRSGFRITSVEKIESRFVVSDLVTELAINLDQMSLEDAAKLLELLVPYRIQLEVLRSTSELTVSPQPTNENSIMEKTNTEVHKEEDLNKLEQYNIVNEIDKQEDEINEVEEIPRLPSVSPPTSPLPSNKVDIPSPSNLPIQQEDSKRGSKTSSEEDQQSTTARSARLATRIPTPKSARSSNRTTIEPIKELNGADKMNGQKPTDFSYQTKRDVLVVSNEETDEFGLTNEQYETLKSNRERLERERQSLRDMGILS